MKRSNKTRGREQTPAGPVPSYARSPLIFCKYLSPSILANKKSQPITNSNRKYLCSFKSRIMSPTTYQKSGRIEVQEDKKIPLLM